MAYEFLKKLFGTAEDGTPVAMTYEQLEAAIDADGGIKIANLKDGGYVDRDKFEAKNTELSGVKKQLDDANAEIQSYKDMDIDGIKKATEEWKTRYETETRELNDRLSAQERSHQADMFFSGYRFTSKPAMRGVRDEFDKKNFPLENGKFLGAEDFMSGLMQDADYEGAFVKPEPPVAVTEATTESEAAKPKPQFAAGTSGSQPVAGKRMSLTEMMKRKNENPNFEPFG